MVRRSTLGALRIWAAVFKTVAILCIFGFFVSIFSNPDGAPYWLMVALILFIIGAVLSWTRNGLLEEASAIHAK